MLSNIMGIFGIYQYTGDEGNYIRTANQTIIGKYFDDLIGITQSEAHLDCAEQSVVG